MSHPHKDASHMRLGGLRIGRIRYQTFCEHQYLMTQALSDGIQGYLCRLVTDDSSKIRIHGHCNARPQAFLDASTASLSAMDLQQHPTPRLT